MGHVLLDLGDWLLSHLTGLVSFHDKDENFVSVSQPHMDKTSPS